MIGAMELLLRAALARGRDWIYPAAGGSSLLAAFLLALVNAGLLGTAVELITAVTLGLALAQSRSRALRS